jgi:outer membrane protein assembly factor BamA
LTPRLRYDRVNNPYRPSRGFSFDARAQMAGGFLGGDTFFFRPVVRYSGYQRLIGRSFLGVHSEVGLIRPFQGESTTNTATVYGVPRTQRFWLGGDTIGPRVFEVRSITPRRFVAFDTSGKIFEIIRDPIGREVRPFDHNNDGILNERDMVELGGNRFFLVQTEWVFPLGQTVEAAFFLDTGASLFDDAPWGFTEARAAAGVELRFYLPVLPVPFRLIFGTPVRDFPGDRTSNFTFSIGRSF